jgi:hypothetical protein
LQAAKNIFQNFYAVKLFFSEKFSSFGQLWHGFCFIHRQRSKNLGLIENFEVHFPVSTVLVKWYLPEKFIPQIISGMECCMRFQQTQGTENSRRCRIRYSPCRLL